jgi:alpha-beta hydrolase superfamily lysophospholipase
MLEESGFQAYAPDWPGHGSSSKPSSSSFDYSQEAYINALDAFVEAVGIKKPFAVVVQVRSCSQPVATAPRQTATLCVWSWIMKVIRTL